MVKPTFKTNEEIKDFIVSTLMNRDSTDLTACSILNTVRSPETVVNFEKFSKKVKEITPGLETIPKKGYVEFIDNDFWEMQDPGLKKLFPEITENPNVYEFLIIVVGDVKINHRTEKVEVVQNRYKFNTSHEFFIY